MAENRTPSAMFKRAEQLRRWEESDTNKQSTSPRTPQRIQFSPEVVFLAACAANDKDEVDRLLQEGYDINTTNVDGLTALHQACIDDRLDMVEFLVSRGANVNCVDNEGWTPLHATSSCGILSIARFLLENGADVAAVNNEDKLPIDIAETNDMKEYLQQVIEERGVDCESARNAESEKLLSDAKSWARTGYPCPKDKKTGATPLHVAAAKGYTEAMKVLLHECIVDPNTVDFDGWTPLHAAALWGNKFAVELLLRNGADPNVRNFAGQTCMDLVEPKLAPYLRNAIANLAGNIIPVNNKRKLPPPHRDVKRVDLENPANQPAEPVVVNDNPSSRSKAPSHLPAEPQETEAPSWRRSTSFRNKIEHQESTNSEPVASTSSQDVILRRTHSFENDRTFYQRYRAVTARIKASSCSSILPTSTAQTSSLANSERGTLPNNEHARSQQSQEARASTENTNAIPERLQPQNTDDNTEPESTSGTQAPTVPPTAVRSSPTLERSHSNPAPSTSTASRNIFKNFFKSFVPPVRDEESETQRKAHAKRVRETRRSTQGVTLDEIKSAEQLIKKKTTNGTEPQPSTSASQEETPAVINNTRFDLEDASVSIQSTPTTSAATEPTVTLPLRRSAASASPVSATASSTPATLAAPASTATPAENARRDSEEVATENRSSTNGSPASTQAALNVIQRRRRPKRRSTGVASVNMNDMVNNTGEGNEGEENDTEVSTTAVAGEGEESEQSEIERSDDTEGPLNYRVLYEAAVEESRYLRALLESVTRELQESQDNVDQLTRRLNQTSISEIDKREKRAMERKLSEMEEELKLLQKLKAENERLKAENRALTRVVSKLTNSAAK